VEHCQAAVIRQRDHAACAIGRPDVGAKLGAILRGQQRTAVDADGLENPYLLAVRTLVDIPGHGLEIYGSGGWVFESPRARWRNPCSSRGFYVSVLVDGF
jgi:hypothetical protein